MRRSYLCRVSCSSYSSLLWPGSHPSSGRRAARFAVLRIAPYCTQSLPLIDTESFPTPVLIGRPPCLITTVNKTPARFRAEDEIESANTRFILRRKTARLLRSRRLDTDSVSIRTCFFFFFLLLILLEFEFPNIKKKKKRGENTIQIVVFQSTTVERSRCVSPRQRLSHLRRLGATF